MPSLSASSFTTTAPRMEISRVETEREMEGFGGGGGVPAEIVEIVGAIVRAVRIDTDENPARVPPTRVEARCCGFAGYSGFTKRRFTESLRIGSRVFLAARSSALDYRASECSFCNLQLAQGTQKPVAHVLKLLAVSFGLMPLDEIPLETVAVKKKKQKNNAR